MLPAVLIGVLAAAFFLLERILPGRELPESGAWYLRTAFLNACQLGITIVAGLSWNRWLQGFSVLHMSSHLTVVLQGFLAWFVGTFVFYWWHRFRHENNFLWRVFHQVHHSPARIEMLTAFYKHPLEIAADSILSSAILFSLLGASLQAAAWYNVFAVLGEFFYHSNLKTPSWFGWFLQRPEHHSIHHQLGVHGYNYGDITWWDRIFGTFRETSGFAQACGFPDGNERKLARMLLFHDEYNS